MTPRLLIRIGIATIVSSLVAACQNATWVGGNACYPQEVDVADFCLSVNVVGARGKAYADRTEKVVNLLIRNRDKDVVLEREYTVVAGDLRWYSTWEALSDLQVNFFEYGHTTADDEAAGLPTQLPRQIFSVAFGHDASSGSFLEAFDPAALELSNRYDARENQRHIIEIHFEGSSDNEARLLKSAADLAVAYGLVEEAPQTGLVGRLAEYSTTAFSLDVHRYDPGRLGVTLEDYGRRDLTLPIAEELRALSGVSGTRRFVSVDLRLGRHSLETVRNGVSKVAEQHHLPVAASRGMFNVLRFGVQDLHVSLDHFEDEGLLKVSIEDSGWHPEFERIEAALRIELDAPLGGAGSAASSNR